MVKQVLVVEDHDSLRRLLGLVLSQDFTVIGATNGLEALGWLRKGNIPDAIITDSAMPELNGHDLIIQLRQSGLFADIPVIVVGDDHSPDVEQQFLTLGAVEYLHKPFSPKYLRDRLNVLLQPVPIA